MTSTAEWVEARLNYESVPAALRGTGSRSLRHHRGRMDAFLRRDDTWIARLSASLSGTQGTGYMGSRAKRSLDILIGGSMLLPALPLILVLMALNRLLHPRHPALFR